MKRGHESRAISTPSRDRPPVRGRHRTAQRDPVGDPENGVKISKGEGLVGGEEMELKWIRQVNKQMSSLRKQIRDVTASKALNPQEKRRRIDNANIQIVKLARETVRRKTKRKQRQTVRSELRTPAREPVVRSEGLAAGGR